ncbi:hypothetical protein NX02_06605 [Sphingomonas sanxanigenens DSM 19645 = NX02]|uniref:Uncharacterized protein n=1 Tax=Sphingomonas sanxanigenens DSM 19645 = NX02 TaxID=1123269 RepID=W0A7I5_9SPHN|nr:hypothetical protein NX02_06605 [Sphingomonas sanxanigenens DSM 19645 = NX02]
MWLAYRGACCTSVSLALGDTVYADEVAGKCFADLGRKRTVD